MNCSLQSLNLPDLEMTQQSLNQDSVNPLRNKSIPSLGVSLVCPEGHGTFSLSQWVDANLSTTNHPSSIVIWGKDAVCVGWLCTRSYSICYPQVWMLETKGECWMLLPCWGDVTRGHLCIQQWSYALRQLIKSAGYKQWISNCFASPTIFTVYPKAPVPGIMPSHKNAGSHFLNLFLALLDTGTMLGNKIPAGLKTVRTTKKTSNVFFKWFLEHSQSIAV